MEIKIRIKKIKIIRSKGEHSYKREHKEGLFIISFDQEHTIDT